MSERDSGTTEPETRSLERLLEALDVVITEVQYQAYRLREVMTARTEEEARYFKGMEAGYESSRDTLKQLQRYQKKRLERLKKTGSLDLKPLDQADAIDIASGRATAFTDDDGAPV